MARTISSDGVRVEQDRGAVDHFRQRRSMRADHRRVRRPSLPAPAARSLRRTTGTRTDRRRCRAAAGRRRRRSRRTGCGRPRRIRAPHGAPGRRTMSPCRPAPGVCFNCGYARTSRANARISPIWFLRGCRSPTESTNGARIRNRSRTTAAAASRDIGRNSGAAAFGTTTTLSSSRSPYTLQNRRRGKLAAGQDPRGPVHRPPHRPAQLPRARSRVKYSGCSRKLTSWTLTTTGTGHASGAVYCTCSRSGRSWRQPAWQGRIPSERRGWSPLAGSECCCGRLCAALSADT